MNLKRIASALAISSVALLGLGTSAVSAAPAPTPQRQATQIDDGSVWIRHLAPPAYNQLITTQSPASIYWSHLNKKIVDKDILTDRVNEELLLGAGSEATFAAKPIANIGGSFTSRATVIGTFEMRKGVWSFNTSAKFDRLNADAEGYIEPTTETYPTLAVRVGPELKEGGTIMGVPISKAGFVELTGSATKTVNIPADGTTVTVYGFGYNENRSDFGSAGEGRVAQFSAAASITIAKLG